MKNELTAAMVYRRQILDRLIELISNQENSAKASIVWSDIGAIERQCDYLKKAVSEFTNEPF